MLYNFVVPFSTISKLFVTFRKTLVSFRTFVVQFLYFQYFVVHFQSFLVNFLQFLVQLLYILANFQYSLGTFITLLIYFQFPMHSYSAFYIIKLFKFHNRQSHSLNTLYLLFSTKSFHNFCSIFSIHLIQIPPCYYRIWFVM